MNVISFAHPDWQRRQAPARARLRVTGPILDATQASLHRAGERRSEGLALWAGRPDGGASVLVSHVVEPETEGEQDWLRTTTAARAEVVAFLRAHDLLVVADVHSHPTEAFLSPVDARHPYSPRVGHLAIVVPDLGRRPRLDGWRAYELDTGGWRERRLEEVLDVRL